MKRILHEETMQFTYPTREERYVHVVLLESQGWVSGGKIKRLKDGISIMDAGSNSDNYEWYAEFWKTYRN